MLREIICAIPWHSGYRCLVCKEISASRNNHELSRPRIRSLRVVQVASLESLHRLASSRVLLVQPRDKAIEIRSNIGQLHTYGLSTVQEYAET